MKQKVSFKLGERGLNLKQIGLGRFTNFVYH